MAEEEAQETASQSQSMLVEDAFPDRDEKIEQLVVQYRKAKQMETKTKDRVTTAYDALKEAMRLRELDVYKCYDTRAKVTLKPDDPKVVVKDVKESEPSPYRPPSSESAA